jgi:hypothetical protein
MGASPLILSVLVFPGFPKEAAGETGRPTKNADVLVACPVDSFSALASAR